VGGHVPHEVRELAADVLLGREPQELYLGRVDMAVRALDRGAAEPRAEALERPRDAVVALALGGELRGVEVLVDRKEGVDLRRVTVEEVVSQSPVLGDAGERVLTPGRRGRTADRGNCGARQPSLRRVLQRFSGLHEFGGASERANEPSRACARTWPGRRRRSP